ncbi:hypothetical protein acsn021_39390 [Anaerocolumna cellulosilytica]|uniref:Uncharacterized protein n=1 Tax=Anaerocolumna cellulosilytica TaxID=433286 RepID=A0A6S6RA61_9FIRM|nr:hypothetical protein [Anaerocolumna cellulosilytica]MBB5196341.1 hypothetical protein [Anaerocolumna cellulosilytica]BCJ96370.1 hypothetical protein acsn021_39390 [Anaerocolumna cellulosilytica]
MKKMVTWVRVAALTLLKWIGILLLSGIKLALELVKVILWLFGLVARIFMAFVRVGTP